VSLTNRLSEYRYLGPLRHQWRHWDTVYSRFNRFRPNHFIATLERQCAELRMIEKEHTYLSKTAKEAYAREAADCISVATNLIRRVTDGSPEALAAVLKDRSSRYTNPNAIIDKYIEEHGA